MPRSLAASTTKVPAGTAILWPSIVTLTSGMRPHLACVPQRVVLVLLAEMAECRIDDPPGRVAQPAETTAVLQPVGDPLENAQLDLRTLVREDAVVRSDRPVAAHAAWCALAAGFVGVEPQ